MNMAVDGTKLTLAKSLDKSSQREPSIARTHTWTHIYSSISLKKGSRTTGHDSETEEEEEEETCSMMQYSYTVHDFQRHD